MVVSVRRTAALCAVLPVLLVGPSSLTSEALGAPAPASRWSVVPSPNVGPLTNVAESVTFVSRTDGWLVGGRLEQVGENTAFRTLVEHWDGSRWSVVPSPDPGIDNNLTGVAALGRDDVWAVGWSAVFDRSGGSVTVPLIEHWDGRRWAVVPTPDIRAQAGTLAAITAQGGRTLWAVGWRSVRYDSRERTLVLRWFHGRWRFVRSQDVAGRYNHLNAVATAGGDVWAVGMSLDASGEAPNRTLVERLRPAGGRIVRSPDPSKDGNELYGVADRGPHDVWAVGAGWDGPESAALAVHYDGRSWRRVARPPAPSGSTLLSVARAGGGRFWAVGFTTSETVRSPLVELWTGRRWVERPSPGPHPYGDMLAAVASLSGHRSMAVGNGIGASGYQRTLVVANWPAARNEPS